MSDEISVQQHSTKSKLASALPSKELMRFASIMTTFCLVLTAGIVYIIFEQRKQQKRLKEMEENQHSRLDEGQVISMIQSHAAGQKKAENTQISSLEKKLEEQFEKLTAAQDKMNGHIQTNMNKMRQVILSVIDKQDVHSKMLGMQEVDDDEEEEEVVVEEPVVASTAVVTEPASCPLNGGECTPATTEEPVEEIVTPGVAADEEVAAPNEKKKHGGGRKPKKTSSTPPKHEN
jgi:preprotein translocase subunit YajC